MQNGVHWPDTIWKEINDAVLLEVGKVRIAQKIFPTAELKGNPMTVPNEVIDFDKLSIEEGATKRFVEIYREFTLTSTQVEREAEQKSALTLALMAAKVLALAEDACFFGSRNRDDRGRKVPAGVVPKNLLASDPGLLAEAYEVMEIPRAQKPDNADYGEETFSAVTAGIAKLVAKGQAQPYALVLPTGIYADTFVPPSNASLVTTADRIRPLLEGGFYSSGMLPDDQGLLVALAGDPTKLYVGREATTEFVRQDEANYIFRVVERVQYVVRDPRALIAFKFLPVGRASGAAASRGSGGETARKGAA